MTGFAFAVIAAHLSSAPQTLHRPYQPEFLRWHAGSADDNNTWSPLFIDAPNVADLNRVMRFASRSIKYRVVSNAKDHAHRMKPSSLSVVRYFDIIGLNSDFPFLSRVAVGKQGVRPKFWGAGFQGFIESSKRPTDFAHSSVSHRWVGHDFGHWVHVQRHAFPNVFDLKNNFHSEFIVFATQVAQRNNADFYPGAIPRRHGFAGNLIPLAHRFGGFAGIFHGLPSKLDLPPD